MTEPSTVHSTFVIERAYPDTPERIFAAFADPAMKRRWFAGGANQVETFTPDFKVGGRERIESRLPEGSPFPGVALVADGVIQDIVTNRRIVTASTMTLGDRRISASLVTIELIQAEHGTNLICTHQGAFFEGSDGPRRREAGWHTLFDRLGAELAP